MYIRQYNKRCNACHNKVTDTVIEVPTVNEVKLSPFAISCVCGYFYGSVHIPLHFEQWSSFRRRLNTKMEAISSEVGQERILEQQFPASDSIKIRLENLKRRLVDLHAIWDDSAEPVPDDVWDTCLYKDYVI